MIKKREKRRRIFYVPGMISLIFIPLFCFYHFYTTDAFKVYGSINLNMPNKGDFEKYKVESLRKFKVYKFSGNEIDDKKKLNEMRFYLKTLRKDKDTVNGIKLHDISKINYNTFIRTIDILALEDAPTWGIFENDIYILGSSNSYKKVKDTTKYNTMNCGTLEVIRQNAYWEQKAKKEEEGRNFKISFFKEKWKLLFLGYAGLVILNVVTLVKLNKNQNYNQK